MVKIPTKLTFAEYLEYEDGTDNHYELVNGELVKVPPESELNGWIATWLRDEFVQFIKRRLVRVNAYEIQVLGNTQNRYPDLVVLRNEHLELTKKRQTITLEMPPPQLVAEVVSPYKNYNDENYRRDYVDKVEQYQARGIPEYWIIDPQQELVTVLLLKDGSYEKQEFRGDERIISEIFPELGLSAAQVVRAS